VHGSALRCTEAHCGARKRTLKCATCDVDKRIDRAPNLNCFVIDLDLDLILVLDLDLFVLFGLFSDRAVHAFH